MRFFMLLAWLLVALAAQAASPRIVFIDPGRHDEAFWANYAGVMRAAAARLGWQVEVRFAERDRFVMRQLAEQALQEVPRPDVLLLVNELPVMAPVVAMADRAGVDVVALNVGFEVQEVAQIGHPRQPLRHWLGTIVPDNRLAGELIGRALVQQHQNGGPTTRMAVLHGVRSSLADIQRYQGLQRFLNTAGHASIEYQLDANWRRDDARLQISRLLTFDRGIDAVWATNDEMALGAADALAAAGQPALSVGGVLGSRPGLDAIMDGRIKAMPSGHFMLGACAIAVLYDYRHGHDFAKSIGTEPTIPIFESVTATNANSWRRLLDPQQWAGLPFERWTRLRGGTYWHGYDCQPSTLLANEEAH
jgi:ABC-type sugar transport system substrate-binding protein